MSKPILTRDAKKADDINAHKARIRVYEKYAAKDVNEILEKELNKFTNNQELTILDVGCGNGKQSLKLAELFPQSKILAMDVSEDAILELRAKNKNQIKAAIIDFNNIQDMQNTIVGFAPQYDVIVSFYAVYYASDVEETIELLMKYLSSQGKMILVGYSRYNNKELLEITNNYTEEELKTSDFIESSLATKLFHNHVYNTYYFDNTISFQDSKVFLDYYQNYGLYSKEIASKVIADVEKKIADNECFVLSKISLVISVEGESRYATMEYSPKHILNDEFSPKLYKDLLGRIISHGYTVVPVSKVHQIVEQSQKKLLILRHDVDLSPLYACQMAEEEAKHGIHSSYYFLISGGFYNMLEPECRSALLAIRDLGHEIGLHYEFPHLIENDLKVLSAIIGDPILSISQHNPSYVMHEIPENLGVIDAYDNRITNEYGFTYISDSGMKWRQKGAFDYLGKERLYILTHPETWYSKSYNLIQLHRHIQQHETNKLRRKYNEYVEGNIGYLKQRQSQN